MGKWRNARGFHRAISQQFQRYSWNFRVWISVTWASERGDQADSCTGSLLWGRKWENWMGKKGKSTGGELQVVYLFCHSHMELRVWNSRAWYHEKDYRADSINALLRSPLALPWWNSCHFVWTCLLILVYRSLRVVHSLVILACKLLPLISILHIRNWHEEF